MEYKYFIKYNRVETLNHASAKAYPNCIKDYNLLILSEDNNLNEKPDFFSDVLVLDLDCAEIIKAKSEKRNQNSTMDSAFVIADEKNKEILLVELRLNYKNLYNLNRKKLIDKVAGSCVLLGNSVKVHSDFIFIFQSNKVQEAKNRISRMIPSLNNNYKVMDLNSLLFRYF